MREIRGQRTAGRGRMSAQSLATVGPLRLRARRGVTLLEVLISIGVLAIGLLGVAHLIPLGTFSVNETAKADRSAAMGRAAMHEVRVRDMLEVRNDNGDSRWCFAKTGGQVLDTVYPLSLGVSWPHNHPEFLLGQAFAIDPMYATKAAVLQGPPLPTAQQVEFDYFPFAPPSITPTDSRLVRLRLDIFAHNTLRMKNGVAFNYGILLPGDPKRANRSARQLAVFDRIFTWQDDLIFDLDEDDPDRRPRQSCLWDNGAIAPYETPTGSGPKPLRSQSANHYSWMLTAEPDPNELPLAFLHSSATNRPECLDALSKHRQKTYTVSIVTFYKRDVTCDAAAEPPCERLVRIDFTSTGIGGGDAMLMVPSAKTFEQAEEYLKVKDNQWILVTGFVTEPRLDAILGAVGTGQRRIAKWYRVIRVDDEIESHPNPGPQTHWIRRVTLAGPDWDGAVSQTSATLIGGAIGVYTTTVTLP